MNRRPLRPSLMPKDTPDYMTDAWVAFIRWAIANDDIRTAFERETGHRYVAPRSTIERAIDKATGYGDAYVKAFIVWANENVWGDM